MKKFGLFLMAVAMVMFAVTTSQAASVGLISSVAFDGNGNNAVAGASNGVPTGATSYVTGLIGQAVDLTVATNTGWVDFGTGADAVPLTGDVFGGSRGLWTGTQSLWVNTTQNIYVAGGKNFTCDRLGNTNMGMYAGYDALNGISFYINGTNGHAFKAKAAGANQVAANSGWHLVTATYNLTTGASGTGTAQIYVDGVAQAMTPVANSIVSSDVQISGGRSVLGADLGGTAGAVPSDGMKGSIDEWAVFNTQLTGDQVAALYNLGATGVAATQYGGKDAATLFDGYLNAAGATTSDSKAWAYVASGLSGAAGSVGADYVVLGANGGGMQIVPEPGTLSLLLAGAMGLLVFAWRRRK